VHRVEAGTAATFQIVYRAKQERHVLDYDDLLLYWFHLLGDETLVTLLNERFDHILVDECQDTNRLQSSILHRMRSLNRNLTVVGDDAQSIYSFRAAEVRNILDFPAEFAEATVVTKPTIVPPSRSSTSPTASSASPQSAMRRNCAR
jgi:DNA helicase-2/ATP-dependent DNA helicase PcrA